MVRIDRVRKRIKDLREAANEPYPATPEGRSEAEKRYERACQAFVNEFPTLASIERALTDIGYAGAATVTRDDYAKWDLQNTYAKKPLPPGSQAPGWTTEP